MTDIVVSALGVSRRRLVFRYGLVPVAFAALLAVYRPAFLARLDSSIYDLLMRSARTRTPSDRVVIVDVDERSLATVGQWPWRRDIVGQLIGRLREAGAAVVALDVVFPESDRYRALDDVNVDAEGRSADGMSISDGLLASTLH